MYYTDKPDKETDFRHRKYTVKSGDTLASVAQALGIAPRELRRYHNTYCPVEDLIEADFKSHLDVVLVPVEGTYAKNTEQEQKFKVAFGANYKLPFLPELTKISFDVGYTIEVGENVDNFEIKMTVACLAVDANKFYLFEINREDDIVINGIAPDTMMEELAAKVGAAVYPLKIVVDATGKWIDIHNYDAIVQRWQQSKEEILSYYEGSVVDSYIRYTEDTLHSKETLVAALRSDYFLRAYFNGIHVGHTKEYSFSNEITFPLEKNVESAYGIVQRVEPRLTATDQVLIEQEGDYIDRSFNLIHGFEPWKGVYKANYLLNKKSFSVEKVTLECSIAYEEPIKIMVVITKSS